MAKRSYTLQRQRYPNESFRISSPLIWNSLRRQAALPRLRLKHRPEALAIYDPRLAPSTNHKYIQLRATNKRCNKENKQRIKEFCDTRHYCSIASNASLASTGPGLRRSHALTDTQYTILLSRLQLQLSQFSQAPITPQIRRSRVAPFLLMRISTHRRGIAKLPPICGKSKTKKQCRRRRDGGRD